MQFFVFLWKILHLAKFAYTASGCDGCDKYEVWMFPHLPPTTEPQDPRSRLRSLSQHLKICGHNLWLFLYEQKFYGVV